MKKRIYRNLKKTKTKNDQAVKNDKAVEDDQTVKTDNEEFVLDENILDDPAKAIEIEEDENVKCMSPVKQFNIKEFEKFIYKVLKLEPDKFFTSETKIVSPDDMRGLSISIMKKPIFDKDNTVNSKAFTFTINDDYMIDFSDNVPAQKKAYITVDFYEATRKKKIHLTKQQAMGLEDLIRITKYQTVIKISNTVLQPSSISVPTYLLTQLFADNCVRMMPTDRRHFKEVSDGDIYYVERGVITSKYDMPKTRAFLIIKANNDEKRALAIPISFTKMQGDKDRVDLDLKYLPEKAREDFEKRQKEGKDPGCQLIFGKADFVGYDALKEKAGHVPYQVLNKYKKKYMECWEIQKPECKVGSAAKRQTAHQSEEEKDEKNNSSSLTQNKAIALTEEDKETKKTTKTEETKNAENTENVETFVPLDRKRLACVYQNGAIDVINSQINRLDYADISFEKYLPLFADELKAILSKKEIPGVQHGIKIGKQILFNDCSVSNRDAEFEGEVNNKNYNSDSVSYIITFNRNNTASRTANYKATNTFPKYSIRATAYSVQLALPGGQYRFNPDLTKIFRNILQKQWPYYYVYLAYNILQTAKKLGWDEEHIQTSLKDAGLKYDGDIGYVLQNFEFNFRPEKLSCYADYYDNNSEGENE